MEGLSTTATAQGQTNNHIDNPVTPHVNINRPLPTERFELRALQAATSMPAERNPNSSPSLEIQQDAAAVATDAGADKRPSSARFPDLETSTGTTKPGSDAVTVSAK
ncbi:hypothetical protein OEA41_003855 [Lepraria neglecta]|uniref:Uncharacterized protein n=1 Tax=Lepraria neglecta TaxID=209136 RepID=A0AAD9Z6C8_9LECA|nr:hypothetical protein OEA41_003855 [Lepraria neglecta]